MKFVRIAAALIASAFWAGSASAANCGPFTDVDSADSFCPYVQFMYNKGISLGCTATTYCPDAYVTRLQMAAFMNRLANAIGPRPLECTRQFGSFVSVPANTYGFGVSATCPSGYTATGLGIEAAANVVMADSAISSSGGTIFTYNLGGTSQSTRAWAQCCRIPAP